jgi:hypothetical protein
MFRPLMAIIRRHSQHYKEMLHMRDEQFVIKAFLPLETETPN